MDPDPDTPERERLAIPAVRTNHNLRVPLLSEAEQHAARDRGDFFERSCVGAPDRRSVREFHSSQASCIERQLQKLGIRTPEERSKVGLFTLAAFLSNAYFVVARNVGTVLFLTHVSTYYLPSVMFLSGTLTVFVGYFFSWASRGRCTAAVNRWLIAVSILLMVLAYLGTLLVDEDDEPIVILLFVGIYLAEDILAMFIAMQCATVAQAAFSVSDAKRLFGLVQLGNSIAAMAVGMTIGSIAKILGTELLLALQSVVLVLYFVVNELCKRIYLDPSRLAGQKKKKKKKLGGAGGGRGPWWKNLLVLAMLFWSFTVMFVKTMYEYEYNILVKESASAEEMVTLTGYLYAGAGLSSTFVNLIGSKLCLDMLGMRGAILVTPGALLSVSIAILISPSVWTTFIGRLVDLCLRWSINNTVKSVLWIAVPTAQAIEAKPWVEGTVKKLASSFNAIVISVALILSGGNMDVLSFLTLGCTGILFLLCLKVYSLYLKSMWQRIRRREVQVFAASDDHGTGPFGDDPNLRRRVLDRLLHGGTPEQLYIIREIGEGLSDADWKHFFNQFYDLSTAVQVKIIELSRKQSFRVPDDFLLRLLRGRATKPALMTASMLAIGERQLYDALEMLEVHLGNHEPSVRAAAATSILRIGWGTGLGTISSAALLVLQEMLGFPLKGGGTARKPSKVHVASSLKAMIGSAQDTADTINNIAGHVGTLAELPRARMPSVESVDSNEVRRRDSVSDMDLDGISLRLEDDWRNAIEAGDTGRAVVLGIQLTHVKVQANLSQRNKDMQNKQSHDPRYLADLEASVLDEDKEQLTKMASVCSSKKQDADVARLGEVAIALEMLQQLPAPRSLIADETWLKLLQHPASSVRVAAMAFVDEGDKYHEWFREERSALVNCLGSANTYVAAAAALRKLDAPMIIQTAVMEEFRQAVDDQKALVSRALLELKRSFSDDQANQVLVRCPSVDESQRHSSGSPDVRIGGLLKFLEHQSSSCEEAELQLLLNSEVCNELLMLSDALSNSDASQQVVSTLVDLKAQGFTLNKDLAESRVRIVAVQICQGLAVKRWIERLKKVHNTVRLTQLCKYISLPCAEGDGPTDSASVDVMFKITLRYIDEHIFLQKSRLLHLAILASGSSASDVGSTTVLAKWRALRDKNDSASQSAAIEVLDSMLPLSLKAIVVPLLDTSPVDAKLSVGVSLRPDLQALSDAPPKWMSDWFMSLSDRLGMELGMMMQFLTHGVPQLPSEQPPDLLLPKLLILWPMKQSEDLLVIHVADIAMIASMVHVEKDAQLCKKHETYIVARGEFKANASGRKYQPGNVVQEMHALSDELPVIQTKCVSQQGGTVVRIQGRDLFKLMVRLPPKFALGLMKSIMRILPDPTQTGGSRAPRKSSHVHKQHLLASPSYGPTPNALVQPLSPLASKGTPKLTPFDSASGGFANGAQLLASPAHQHLLPEYQLSELDESPQTQANRLHEQGVANLDGLDEDLPGSGTEQNEGKAEATTDDLALIAKWHTPPGSTKGAGPGEDAEDEVNVEPEGEPGTVADEDQALVAQPAGGYRNAQASFSMLEKLMLLQAVKIFRYVPLEYLPFIASSCEATFHSSGTEILQEDTPTNGTLHIIADGCISLNKSGFLQRTLNVSDSMGNTALLLDHQWQYTAKAQEDVWLISLSRADLTDALRGRRELASAVIRGLYKTLTRRMQLAIERTGDGKSDFSYGHR